MVQMASARAVDKKREILQAAGRVFRRRGLHDAGMRDIAAESGMTAGNLYYYFRSKHDLLAFCQEDALAGLLELASGVRAAGLRPDAQLHALIVGHVELLNESTPGSLAHLEVEALEGDWRRTIQRRRDRYERALRAILDAGAAGGVFRVADAAVAARAILGAVNWTVKWFRPGGPKSAREIGREIADILVRGVMAPGVELATATEG
jgi:TetR/AcrR family transcriptional regulator, cholesterol catabolism regulator